MKISAEQLSGCHTYRFLRRQPLRGAGFTGPLDPQIAYMTLARIETVSRRAVVAAHLDDIRIAEIEHLALRDLGRFERGVVAGRHLRQAGDYVADRALRGGVRDGLAGIRILLEVRASAEKQGN